MRSEQRSEAPFAIEVAAQSEHVPWVRAFVAAVAAACGLDPDTVADVRLAVAELVSHVAMAGPGTELRVCLEVVADRLELAVLPWPSDTGPLDDLEPWVVVTSLFDDARIAGNRAVFSAPIPAPS